MYLLWAECHLKDVRPGSIGLWVHSGQTLDPCAVTAILKQKQMQTNFQSFTLTAKLNAVSENLSFLL